MADDRWQDVEPARIHEVRASNLAAAAKLLDTASWIELNPETARDLTGQPLPDSPPTKFYLVRAVYLNRGTGKFYIRTTNGYLWVAHGCLGARPVPMKRQPLVVQLEHPPKDVYVSCSMAQ